VKGFSLIEPWASLVVLGKKRVETRSWRMPDWAKGLRVAIHASKSREAIEDGTASELFDIAELEVPDKWNLGAIIGTVELVRCEPTETIRETLYGMELDFGNYISGRFAWVMDQPHQITKPVPCRGMLGLWEVPKDIEAQLVTILTPDSRNGA
jgi:hypothetical protein